METSEAKGIWTGLTSRALALGGVHALVDAASGFLVFRDVGSGRFDARAILTMVILYNALAFGGQALAGLLADRRRSYKAMALAGAALCGAALLVSPTFTWLGVVIVGVGNALYHVGAGAVVLAASGERTTEAGVFVGPGAVGLAAGILCGGQGVALRYPLVALLLLSAPLLLVVMGPLIARTLETSLPEVRSRAALWLVVCLGCLLGSVAVRALVGGAVSGTWRGVSTGVMVLLALAACGGKMAGGFVSDRLGWAATSVAALLLSLPLVSYLVEVPACAVLGMLIFQMTMPVTLKAVHHLMPSRPGLAFGVPCVALLAGALPGISGLRLLDSWVLVLVAVILSTLMVALGLVLLVRLGASGGLRVESLRGLLRRAEAS